MAAAYAFKAEPRAVTNRPKYREDAKPASLQFDPRVYRGVTCSSREPTSSVVLSSPVKRRPKPVEPSPFAIPLPEPERSEVDLSDHLLAPAVVVESTTVDSQTDAFLPEEPEPEFVPPKTGLDVATQVLPNELFHFDDEVAPILSVLVTKTLEQALTEVEEEEETANVATFKEEWQKRQAALMADWAKTVQAECMRAAQKAKLLAQARQRKEREQQLFRKLHCARLADEYLKQVVPGATRRLMQCGHFAEELREPIEIELCSWLTTTAVSELERRFEIQQVVSGMVSHVAREAEQARAKGWAAFGEAMKERAKIERKRKEALRGKIRILLDKGDGTMIEIGPIKIRSDEPMDAVHQRTFEWLQEHHPDVAANAPYGVVLYIGESPAEKSSALFTAPPGSIVLKQAAAPEEAPAESPPPEG